MPKEFKVCNGQQSNACSLIAASVAEYIQQNQVSFENCFSTNQPNGLIFEEIKNRSDEAQKYYQNLLNSNQNNQDEFVGQGISISMVFEVMGYISANEKLPYIITQFENEGNVNISFEPIENYFNQDKDVRQHTIGTLSNSAIYKILQEKEIILLNDEKVSFGKFCVGLAFGENCTKQQIDSVLRQIKLIPIQHNVKQTENPLENFFQNCSQALATADGHTVLIGHLGKFYYVFDSNSGKLMYDTSYEFIAERFHGEVVFYPIPMLEKNIKEKSVFLIEQKSIFEEEVDQLACLNYASLPQSIKDVFNNLNNKIYVEKALESVSYDFLNWNDMSENDRKKFLRAFNQQLKPQNNNNEEIELIEISINQGAHPNTHSSTSTNRCFGNGFNLFKQRPFAYQSIDHQENSVSCWKAIKKHFGCFSGGN